MKWLLIENVLYPRKYNEYHYPAYNYKMESIDFMCKEY